MRTQVVRHGMYELAEDPMPPASRQLTLNSSPMKNPNGMKVAEGEDAADVASSHSSPVVSLKFSDS
jgi:hypothetical protein